MRPPVLWLPVAHKLEIKYMNYKNFVQSSFVVKRGCFFFVSSARPYIYVVATLPAATSFRSQKSIGFSTHRRYCKAMPGI